MRYTHLIDAVREKNPRSILEIGTWNGERARQMLALCPEATYYGFDLFEDATRQTDADELNVKAHWTLESVYDKLVSGQNEGRVFLVKGNTRETLKSFKPIAPVDFVWIDGGHSVETIRSDLENVRRVVAPDAWVFMDDYYSGPTIDTTKFGCNEIVRDLRHEVLPTIDWVKGGGSVQMVRVWL